MGGLIHMDYSNRFENAIGQLRALAKSDSDRINYEDEGLMMKWLSSFDDTIVELASIKTLCGIDYYNNQHEKALEQIQHAEDLDVQIQKSQEVIDELNEKISGDN